MAKYFKSRLTYYRARDEVKTTKPESDISCHITLQNVISGLFYTKYLHCCSL